MTTAFDAVLIGAGHNTLACALHLAARGWKVGVFEQAPTAGGAVKTGELVKGEEKALHSAITIASARVITSEKDSSAR